MTREQMWLRKEYETLINKQLFKPTAKQIGFKTISGFVYTIHNLKRKLPPSPEGRGDLAALRTAAAFSPYGDLSLSYEYIVRYCRERLTN